MLGLSFFSNSRALNYLELAITHADHFAHYFDRVRLAGNIRRYYSLTVQILQRKDVSTLDIQLHELDLIGRLDD